MKLNIFSTGSNLTKLTWLSGKVGDTIPDESFVSLHFKENDQFLCAGVYVSADRILFYALCTFHGNDYDISIKSYSKQPIDFKRIIYDHGDDSSFIALAFVSDSIPNSEF